VSLVAKNDNKQLAIRSQASKKKKNNNNNNNNKIQSRGAL